MAAMEPIEIEAGEYTFSGRAAGPAGGRTVFLLHGFPQTSYAWRHVLSRLGDAGYRAVAPDQRGYSEGARPEGVEYYRMPFLVADVMAMADSIGAHQIDVVGHDWGGAVAWNIAGQHPERLRTVTSVSTPHPSALSTAIRASAAGEDRGGDQAQRSSYMLFFRQEGVAEDTLLGPERDGAGLRSLYEGSGLAADEAGEYVRVLTQPGALTGALNWYRAADVADLGDSGPVTTPCLYVWSTGDIALGREAAEATEQYVKGPYRFEILDGISHWIPEKAPEDLSRLLLEHLAAHG